MSSRQISAKIKIADASTGGWERPLEVFCHPPSGKVIVFWVDSNRYLRAVVVTPQGLNATFGAASIFSGMQLGSSSHSFLGIAFDDVSGKFVVVFEAYNFPYYAYAMACDLAGDTVTFGTPAALNSYRVRTIGNPGPKVAFHGGNGAVFLQEYSSPYVFRARGIRVVEGGIVLGNLVEVGGANSSSAANGATVAVDPATGGFVFAYGGPDGLGTRARPGTIATGDITLGSEQNIYPNRSIPQLLHFVGGGRVFLPYTAAADNWNAYGCLLNTGTAVVSHDKILSLGRIDWSIGSMGRNPQTGESLLAVQKYDVCFGYTDDTGSMDLEAITYFPPRDANNSRGHQIVWVPQHNSFVAAHLNFSNDDVLINLVEYAALPFWTNFQGQREYL